jgi:CRISPR-associated protein Csx3
MQASECILSWNVTFEDRYTVAFFTIVRKDGILEHELLKEVCLPKEVQGREDRGLIISGRGPVWLYAHLTHLAHTFAWLGIYEPRHRGAIVVERHVQTAPSIGEIIPCRVPGEDETSREGSATERPRKEAQ